MRIFSRPFHWLSLCKSCMFSRALQWRVHVFVSCSDQLIISFRLLLLARWGCFGSSFIAVTSEAVFFWLPQATCIIAIGATSLISASAVWTAPEDDGSCTVNPSAGLTACLCATSPRGYSGSTPSWTSSSRVIAMAGTACNSPSFTRHTRLLSACSRTLFIGQIGWRWRFTGRIDWRDYSIRCC